VTGAGAAKTGAAVPRGGSRPRSRSQSRGSAAAVNTFYVDVYICTKPTTTTPPTRRENTATVLPFPPPWSLSRNAPAASRRAAMFTMSVC
jgi:hypothetical protein